MIVWAYLRSFCVILCCLFCGHLAAQWQTLLPASISGMLILFIALASGLVKPHWVQVGAEGLLKYMAVLFVPVGVGLIDHLPEIRQNGLAILLCVIIATLLTLLIVGHTFQYIVTRDNHD